MNGVLQGQVAVVTGGTRGIGRSIVEAFVANGARVVFTYEKHRAEAERLEARWGKGRKSPVSGMRADARRHDLAHKVIDHARERFGAVHILVNNVGIAMQAPIWQMTEDAWDRVLDTTLKSCFNYCRAVAPVFRAQHHGRIINIGSINGLRGRKGTSSYCAAKAGLIGFTKSIALELGPYGVTANVIAPGFVETEGQRETSELVRDLVLRESAIHELVQPVDIGAAALYLAGPGGRFVTGAVIKVDAGAYM